MGEKEREKERKCAKESMCERKEINRANRKKCKSTNVSDMAYKSDVAYKEKKVRKRESEKEIGRDGSAEKALKFQKENMIIMIASDSYRLRRSFICLVAFRTI